MKIDIQKTDLIDSVLRGVQGKCKVNLISSAFIQEFTAKAQERLNDAIPISYQAGARAYYRAAGPTPNMYKHMQGATCFAIERGSRNGKWYLISVRRDKLLPKAPEVSALSLNEKQIEWANKNLLSKYCQI